MNEKQYTFPLPVGTIIRGGIIPGNKKGEHYQYHVEEVLGQGGFGITYKVWALVKIGNATTKAYFAVKEHFVRGRCRRAADGTTVDYSQEMGKEVEDSLKDFIKEGRLLNAICKVKNPDDPKNDGWRHVVPVNEVVEANNTAYFVMEYLDGGSVREKVPEGGLDEQVALAYMKPICRAVAYIHRHRILHLDIKPDNIVMRRDPVSGIEEPVLIDFGVSYHFDSQGNLTSTHTTLGHSDGFSPIEQYSIIDSFHPQVDVYALGATLFYLLTGKEPPKSVNVKVDTIASLLPPSVSERTRAAIVHAMAKDSDYRTPTVERFLDELAESITLPIGSLVKSDTTQYFVAETVGIHHGYIEYSCVKDEKAINRRLGTKTLQYRLLEQFVKGVHRRRKNHSVIADGDGKFVDSFSREVQRSMEMTELGECHMNGEQVERELFRYNGTLYAVCDKRFRPESSFDKMKKKWSGGMQQAGSSLPDGMNSLGRGMSSVGHVLRKALKPLAMLAAVAVLTFGLYKLWPTMQGWFQSENETIVARNDSTALHTSQDSINLSNNTEQEPSKDDASVADALDNNNQEETAKLENDDEVFNQALSSRNYTALKRLADSGYAKAHYPLAKHYYDSSDYSNAKKYAQKAVASNTDKAKAQTLLDKIAEKEKDQNNSYSLDAQFAKAKTISDYRVLADKGYAKAYAPLANLYMNQASSQADYDNANKYAQKAISSGVNTSLAQQVVKKLRDLGYYDY